MRSTDAIAFFLFAMECYHLLAHLAILCRQRLLPRRDLVRLRVYFVFDTASVFISSFLFTGQLRWLATLQILQHVFYIFTWENSRLAKRIVDWSSLDWFHSHKVGNLEIDSILGTLFDAAVHVAMMYCIGHYMSMMGMILGIVTAQAALYLVLFNPKFAWSHPQSMPSWVKKRIGPLNKQ